MKQFSNTINNILRFAVAIFAVLALTAHAQNNPDANSIQSLSVSGAVGGKLVIKVGLKSALANPPAGFSINTPPRIAFDFPNTANGLGKSTQEFGEGALRSANIVQAGNRTRLVVNLNEMLSYDTQIEGNTLLITLQGKNRDTSALLGDALSPIATRFAEAKPNAQQHSLRDIDFHRGKSGEGRIQVDLSDANMGIDIRQQGKSLIVDFMKTALPHNLQRKLDVTDFGTPIDVIDTFVDGDNVRMVIQSKGNWEQAAYQTDNKFIVEIKPVEEDPNKLIKGSQAGFAGEKLTLNFQKIAVREALYVISDFINSNNIPMNMVISDSVTGDLTLRLKDVPWDQALDIILKSKDLDMRKNGNVIQIAPREELAAKEKLSLASSQDISDLETLHTESFPLSYAKGNDVALVLRGITTGMAAPAGSNSSILSKRGSVVVDQRTNTIFVKDTPTSLEEVRKMIKQMDTPVRQVMIEARFVNAQTSFSKSLGGKLLYQGPTPGIGTGTPISSNGTQALLFPTSPTNTINNNLGVPAPGNSSAGYYGGATLQLFNAAATKILNLEIDAAEDDGLQKNIASPRVMTADSTEATISKGVQIPYVTTAVAGATPSTTFATADLSLKVTPKITPDDHINMKLDISNDTVGAQITTGAPPTIDTNKITTQALVENGGTVVVGGVYSLDSLDNTSKVPLLGDIPVLGWLFKTNTKTETKTELLIFITPKILKDTLNLR
jgi:type IV pilus assembly protein PilQ